MPIQFECPECSREYNVNEKFAGKKIQCKDCGAKIQVPSAEKPARKSGPADEFEQDSDDPFGGFSSYDYQEAEKPRKKLKKQKKKKSVLYSAAADDTENDGWIHDSMEVTDWLLIWFCTLVAWIRAIMLISQKRKAGKEMLNVLIVLHILSFLIGFGWGIYRAMTEN